MGLGFGVGWECVELLQGWMEELLSRRRGWLEEGQRGHAEGCRGLLRRVRWVVGLVGEVLSSAQVKDS